MPANFVDQKPLHHDKDQTGSLRHLLLKPFPQNPSAVASAKADGGGERNRTDDLLLAKQALSQLSYTPTPNRRPFARYIPHALRGRAGAGCCMHVLRTSRSATERHPRTFEAARERTLGASPKQPSSIGGVPTEAAKQRRLVGQGRFELPTSRLSSARSNQLSY